MIEDGGPAAGRFPVDFGFCHADLSDAVAAANPARGSALPSCESPGRGGPARQVCPARGTRSRRRSPPPCPPSRVQSHRPCGRPLRWTVVQSQTDCQIRKRRDVAIASPSSVPSRISEERSTGGLYVEYLRRYTYAMSSPANTDPRMSPDGKWWWNGEAWISAISPDGLWRFDGKDWLPFQQQSKPLNRRRGETTTA
jgi:hypothetical protein